jgi:hypothetical protein
MPQLWMPPQAATLLELRTKLGTPSEPWGHGGTLGCTPMPAKASRSFRRPRTGRGASRGGIGFSIRMRSRLAGPGVRFAGTALRTGSTG